MTKPQNKIEDLVTSLDLSKKLKEAGVPQESVFYWDSHAKEKTYHGFGITSDGEYSAYTAGEISEMFPKRLKIDGVVKTGTFDPIDFYPYLEKKSKDWKMRYRSPVKLRMYEGENADIVDNLEGGFHGDTLIWAMSKMLLYLIENNLLNPKDL